MAFLTINNLVYPLPMVLGQFESNSHVFEQLTRTAQTHLRILMPPFYGLIKRLRHSLLCNTDLQKSAQRVKAGTFDFPAKRRRACFENPAVISADFFCKHSVVPVVIEVLCSTILCYSASSAALPKVSFFSLCQLNLPALGLRCRQLSLQLLPRGRARQHRQ
jgi:hypothetical protein